MITNDRQYRITKTQLSKVKKALRDFDFKEAEKRIGSTILAKAEQDALSSEKEDLTSQINEYEALRSGKVDKFEPTDLSELPSILIRARIAQGLSQRKLADLLGLKEQQVQRYESNQYATANLRRLIEVAKALNLNITEIAELTAPIRRAG